MPPPRLPQHLSHKSALVLLPPASITAPIERIRRNHDKQFHRWPPHINLIYPFLASPSEVTDPGRSDKDSEQSHLKEDIGSRIRRVAQNIQPFNVLLRADPPGTFIHSKRSATVWLEPRLGDASQPSKPLHELQALLQSEFSECDADDRDFTPHLSVGQAAGAQGAENLSKEVQTIIEDSLSPMEKSKHAEVSSERPVSESRENEHLIGLKWKVDEVHVIERKGFHGRFKIVGSIRLGQP